VLSILGAPQFQGQPIKLERALFLVAILVCQDAPMTRDELMLLVWADDPHTDLKRRLRQLIHRTKQQPYGIALETKDEMLAYSSQSDVALFRHAVQTRDWQQALDLYQGQLLAGTVFEHSELEEWFGLERDILRADFVKAALAHASTLEPAQAANFLENAMQHDPHNEDLLRRLLESAKAAPEVGVRAFAKYGKALSKDLGLEPPAELRQLAQQLEGNLPALPVRKMGLPVPRSPFFGRQAELESLAGLLPNNRLVTLLGVGGIGKTRLALEVAYRQQPAYFVDLARLKTPDLLPNAILEALGERAEGNLLERLEQVLHLRHVFLILDNFEHLMPARDLVAQLLEQHPHLHLLITSRERLSLAQEQVFEVGGMPAPDKSLPLATQDAAKIFVRAAQRSKLEFNLNNDFESFERIYHAVAGTPLGLELSASWVRSLSLPEIASELQSSLDVLAVDSPDLPERHRSFAAVFGSSWQLLSDEEQRVLSQLAIFRGGFDKEMAKKVGNANLTTLLKLVNKSLVTRREQRFVMHELVRQYSESQNQDPQDTLTRLGATMLELSEAWMQHKNDEQQVEYLERLELEHDNFRSVLQWSLDHQPNVGAKIAGHLEHFWYLHGHRQEGHLWAKQFLDRHQAHDSTLLNLLWAYCSLSKELSLYDEAKNGVERYAALAKDLGDVAALANSQRFLGIMAREKSQFGESQAHLEQARMLFEQLQDHNNLGSCHNELGIVAAMQKDLVVAKNHFQQSLHLKRMLHDQQGIAYALANLGSVIGLQGDHALELVLQEESLNLKRKLGDKQGIATSLHQMGAIALEQDRPEDAIGWYAEALLVLLQIGRRYGITITLYSISNAAWRLAATQTALEFIAAAIHWRYQIRSQPEKHWLERQKEYQEQSGFSAAKLAKLEFEVQKLSLEQVVQDVVTWTESCQQSQKVGVMQNHWAQNMG
jgi:predicted ATPase/DNA-binding SARP family transcriptional activator